MLRQALAKLIMRAAGDQAKTLCGNLQLCVGLEASIKGENHAVKQQRLDRSRQRRIAEMAGSADKEEERGGVEACLNNLSKELAGTEEEVTEDLKAALGM